MRLYKHIFLFIVALLVGNCTFLIAQNLEVISLKKGGEVSGSLNVNAVGYKAFGIEQRRDPFAWYLSGGLNLTLFGYAAPFSFSYSNTNKSYSQPFNQFNFAPQYKWIKTYTGNTSMTFSPYTLAGHVFFGGGVELSPGKWRVAIMYGRLRKAVSIDIADTLHYANAAYKRMGYGLKVGYEANGNAISFNIFKAKDDPASLPFSLPEHVITPQQNVALGISGRKTLFRNIFVNIEYAVSVLNNNQHANIDRVDSIGTGKNILQSLLPGNTTNRYFDAVNTSIGYQGRSYTVQFKYERIAPEYHTLGAYYFNNDMRNITVVANTRLLKNKLTLGSNVGVQRNNLDGTRASTSSRVVASVNVQIAPTPQWNASVNYSNFSSFTKVRPRSEPFFHPEQDSLNFYQISETMNGSMAYSFGSENVKHNISFNGSFQKASNAASGTAPPQLSDFLNGSLSYGFALTPANLAMSVALAASTNNTSGTTTSFFGPAINASKSIFGKSLKTSWSAAYSETKAAGSAASSPIVNSQLSFTYTPAGKEGDGEDKKSNVSSKSSFSVRANMLRQLGGNNARNAFTEWTITFDYSYSF
ncbi:hypothetical protein [Parachryseolinea silvisoli]|uniref:hypothetical protein n=1 Tax=Parachryseolinea silvisoli TaxID=2873601 RepID=UPI00226596BA|nr:hypothetical protein [Parachryseolinea silvisoli]MCD9016566.1 hypothetical protein [Parachryseolinea silvisoli]